MPVARVTAPLEHAGIAWARRALAQAVDRVPPERLERLGDRDVVVGGILRALARLVAAHEPTLRADIVFVVAAPTGEKLWTLRARDGRAGARPVAVVDPDLTLRLDLADLLSLAAARTTGVALLVKSRLKMEGSMVVAMALMRAVDPRAGRRAEEEAPDGVRSEARGRKGQ